MNRHTWASKTAQWADTGVSWDGLSLIGAFKKSKTKVQRIEVRLNIDGKKEFKFKKTYKVIGKLIRKVKKYLFLKAKRNNFIEYSYILKASKNIILDKQLNLIALKEYNIQYIDILKAKKKINSSYSILCRGYKKYQYFKNKKIIGKKSFNIKNNTFVNGILIKKLKRSIYIDGKKDITNILVALDLLGEE